MWTSHDSSSSQDAGYPPWLDAAGMDPDPLSSSMGAGLPGMSFTDPGHANQLAAVMKNQIQALSARVQKLERSRGQITKDIGDMLSESREMMRVAGIDVVNDGKKDASYSSDAAEVGRGATTARKGSRAKTIDVAAMQPQKIPESSVRATSSGPRTGAASKVVADSVAAPPGLVMPLPESLSVTMKDVEGKQIPRVQWRIDNVKGKFKDCIGRPLVSPSFEVAGLPDCRLMVSPTLRLDTTGLSMREQKLKYEARIQEGPVCGQLKFKVVTSVGDELLIKFSLFVGSVHKGPLEHDFAEHVIHGVDFTDDWLDQLQGTSLTVGVDVLEVQRLS